MHKDSYSHFDLHICAVSAWQIDSPKWIQSLWDDLVSFLKLKRLLLEPLGSIECCNFDEILIASSEMQRKMQLCLRYFQKLKKKSADTCMESMAHHIYRSDIAYS